MRRALISFLICGLSTGCDGGDRVTLAVEVLTDLVPGREFASVETVVQVEDGITRTERVAISAGAAGDVHRVADWSDLPPSGAREVTVRLFAPSGALVGERRLLVSNRVSQAIRFIYTRSCLAIACPSGRSCLDGVCVDPRCLTGAEPECAGLMCDTTTCVASSACDDPACVDGVCLHRAGSGSCDAAEVCVPSEGCVPALGIEDAGIPDAEAGDGSTASRCRPPVGDCDYLDQDCPSGGSCVPQIDSTGVTSVCAPPGIGALGAACADTSDCGQGLVCQDAECTELCCPGRAETTCSQAGRRCEALADGLVGYCIRDQPCDPFAQTGCVPPLSCYELSTTTGEVVCLEPGLLGEGLDCRGQSECLPGMRCTGRCRSLCTDTCPDALRCVTYPLERYGACYPDECDPIAQTDCAPGEACYPVGSNLASCLEVVMSLAVGEPCAATNYCASGSTCAQNFCRAICSVGGSPCPRGETCTAFMGPTPRLFGACLP